MNRIICCDCIEGARTLETGSVPLTVTSPPYDKVRNFAPFDFESLAHELHRVTMPGGVVVWVVGDQIIQGSESGTSFRQALFFKDVGFRLQTMIYEPGAHAITRPNRYGVALQYMFVLTKGRPRCVNHIHDKKNRYAGAIKGPRPAFRGREPFRHQKAVRKWGRRGTIWFYAVGNHHTTKDRYAFEHPALMPELLAKDHILSWSKPGDLVLDPFMGAGTTAKMAVLTGRQYLGFEIDPEFVRLAERRLRDASLQILRGA